MVSRLTSQANLERRTMSETTTVANAHSFGRYRVTKSLGSGAMGDVYEAIDDVLGRVVAIKTLRNASGLSARFIDERFRNEARAIAQFSHPGVVQVFDIDLTANPPFLVMEKVTGPSLEDRVTSSGPLSPTELVSLGIQIARALAAAHAAGVVHRDVKPSNVLGAGVGIWKLADFGVAHVPDSSLTMTGQFVGSPAYAAPEALVKGISAPPGDIYGLGATLYEAAAGKWPRALASGALLAPVPPLRELAPQVPAHIADAIDRAVSIDADRRPSATELADQIASLGAGADSARIGSSGPRDRSAPARARRAMRWQPWAIAGAIVLAIILVLALRHGGDAKKPIADSPAPRTYSPDELPDQIELRYPPNMSEKAAHDWEKVARPVYDNNFNEALDKLDEWEDRYGKREETDFLRAQLEKFKGLDDSPPAHGHKRKR